MLFSPNFFKEFLSIRRKLFEEVGRIMRMILNLFFILLAAIVFVLFFHITRGFFIIAVGISFLCLACPIAIHYALDVILNEKNKVDMQILHGIPVCFDKKKVFAAYVRIFILFGGLSGIGFLLPEGLWILVFPPLGVIDFVILKLTEHTWIAFGWSKRTYWLLNGLITGIIVLSLLLYRCSMIR